MDDTQITLPATFHIENMAQDGEPIKTDYSLYKVKHSLTGDTVTISRDFAIAGIRYSTKGLPFVAQVL